MFGIVIEVLGAVAGSAQYACWAGLGVSGPGPNKILIQNPDFFILILIKTDYKLYFRFKFKIISLVLHRCKLRPCMEL